MNNTYKIAAQHRNSETMIYTALWSTNIGSRAWEMPIEKRIETLDIALN